MKLEEIKNKTKEATDYLVQSLEAGHSEVLTQYLAAMAKFHTYSFGNIMLIARQKPSASNVAGVRAWNSLGRFVRRGEKGILILAPLVGRKVKTVEEITGEKGEEKNPQAQLYGFRAVYVFDISQTEGKDLPVLTEVQGDVSGYRERLVKFVAAQSIELRYSDKIGPAKPSYEHVAADADNESPNVASTVMPSESGIAACDQTYGNQVIVKLVREEFHSWFR